MVKRYNEVGKKYESRPLTAEEEKELRVNSMKRVEPILHALEKWIAESLYSEFRY